MILFYFLIVFNNAVTLKTILQIEYEIDLLKNRLYTEILFKIIFRFLLQSQQTQIASAFLSQIYYKMNTQLQHQMTRYHGHMIQRLSNPTYASSNVGSTLGMNQPFLYRHPVGRYSLADIHPVSQQKVQTTEPLPRRSSSQLSNFGSNSLKSLNRYISSKQVYEKQSKKYNIISSQPREYQDTINVFPKYRLQDSDINYEKRMNVQSQISAKLKVGMMGNPESVELTRKQRFINNRSDVL